MFVARGVVLGVAHQFEILEMIIPAWTVQGILHLLQSVHIQCLISHAACYQLLMDSAGCSCSAARHITTAYACIDDCTA